MSGSGFAGATGLRSLRRFGWRVGVVALLAASLVGCGDDSPQTVRATFRNLGFLPGYASSQPTAVSADGTVVVGLATTAAGSRQGFRWNVQQGMVGLGFLPGGFSSMATAVSANGTVIVGVGDATGSEPSTPSAAFRWTPDAGVRRVESLPGSSLCSAGGVSGDGATVVGTCLQVNNTAYRWTAATGAIALTRFGGGSNQQSSAAAISLDAALVVGAGHPVLTGAVTWAADGSSTVLGLLPGDAEATATAVSRDGSTVVGASKSATGTQRAFRWSRQTGLVALGSDVAGLTGTYAAAVSGDGRLIAGWGPTATGDVALVWDGEHGVRLLEAALLADYQTQVPGWKLARATAVSDDGRTIAGYGSNPQGATEAWIVRLP